MSRKFFYDGGASSGETFDWYLLKGPFTDHHIVCFEPSPRHLAALREKCLKVETRFASLRIVTAALGVPGLQPFYDGPTAMGDALRPRGPVNGTVSCEVSVISLGAYLQSHTEPGDEVTLKLDIEGAEYDVLDDLLTNGPLNRLKQVLVEWHGDDPRRGVLANRFAAQGLSLERWPF